MKWDKLLKKLYAACLNHDRAEEMRLYFKALKDRKSTRLNSSHSQQSRMPSSA